MDMVRVRVSDRAMNRDRLGLGLKFGELKSSKMKRNRLKY